jgi:hypothetical protein
MARPLLDRVLLLAPVEEAIRLAVVAGVEDVILSSMPRTPRTATRVP